MLVIYKMGENKDASYLNVYIPLQNGSIDTGHLMYKYITDVGEVPSATLDGAIQSKQIELKDGQYSIQGGSKRATKRGGKRKKRTRRHQRKKN